MEIQHKNLAAGRWTFLPLVVQMAHIGSEIHRAISWRRKNPNYSRLAVDRALELLDLTIEDRKNKKRKELWRLREAIVDFFYFDNQFHSTDRSWQRYFDAFAHAASLNVSGRLP